MSFQASNRAGKAGEAIFFDIHYPNIERLDGRKSDFRDRRTGEFIELKTDYWDFSATKNFYFERWSDEEKQKPGGPWQSLENGNDTFVYMFPTNLVYYVFPLLPLVQRLDDVCRSLEPFRVANRSWVSTGYRVTHDLVRDLAEEVRLTVKVRE